MSNTPHPLTPILQWVLDGQDDDGPMPAPTEVDTEHLLWALYSSAPLGQNKGSAILASPSLRARLRYLAEQERAELLFSWKGAGIDDRLERLAAADTEHEPVTLRNHDFELTLLPLDATGSSWVLNLRMERRVVETLSGSAIELFDDDDIWLGGVPDADGELSGAWSLPGSPTERLNRTTLRIRPR